MSAIQREIVQALQRSAERLRLPGLADELAAMVRGSLRASPSRSAARRASLGLSLDESDGSGATQTSRSSACAKASRRVRRADAHRLGRPTAEKVIPIQSKIRSSQDIGRLDGFPEVMQAVRNIWGDVGPSAAGA